MPLASLRHGFKFGDNVNDTAHAGKKRTEFKQRVDEIYK